MKQNIIQITFIAFIMAFLVSCHDHDDLLYPYLEKVFVEFDSTRVIVFENDEKLAIQLSFSKPANQSGHLILSLSNSLQSRFTFEPAMTNGQINLNVLKGQQSAIINLIPINNSIIDGNQEFKLTIASASSGYSIGSRKSVSVAVLDDDSSAAIKSAANFKTTDKNLHENESEGKSIEILFSNRLQEAGSIEVSFESNKAIYGTHFITIPGLIDGRIILDPAIGADKADLRVIPINNSIIAGELEIKFTINATTGSIVKGTEINSDIRIIDDELTNKPKGFELSDGRWTLKKFFEYNEDGRVKFIHIEKSSPAISNHTETYFYDDKGRIQKINIYPKIDMVFTWSMGKIIKTESIDNGVVKELIEYEYDDRGNVSGTANYFRQNNGQFKLGFINVFMYFLDNNLYKLLTYIPTNGSNQYTLISTKTYDGYLNKENPFPMVDILPTIKTQNQLPSTYIIEEQGQRLIYQISYEFREDGRVSRRIVTNKNLSETSRYLYY